MKAPIKNKGLNSHQTWRNNTTYLWWIKDSAIRYRRMFLRDKAWTMLTYSFNSSNSGTSNNNTNSKLSITNMNNGWASKMSFLIMLNRKTISEKLYSKKKHPPLIYKRVVDNKKLHHFIFFINLSYYPNFIIKNFILWKNS